MRFFTSLVRLKQLKLPLYATETTHKFLTENGIEAHMVHKIQEKKTPNAATLFESGKVDLAINITDINTQKDLEDGAKIRREAIDNNVYLITNIIQAWQYIRALHDKKLEDLLIKSWDEYR
jgi:carbamoyl-phosphate synthase large subunit